MKCAFYAHFSLVFIVASIENLSSFEDLYEYRLRYESFIDRTVNQMFCKHDVLPNKSKAILVVKKEEEKNKIQK